MKNLSKYALALGAVALAMVPEVAHAAFVPGMSAASCADIAGQITQMANQTSGTPALVSWGAYIMGTIFVVIGYLQAEGTRRKRRAEQAGSRSGLLVHRCRPARPACCSRLADQVFQHDQRQLCLQPSAGSSKILLLNKAGTRLAPGTGFFLPLRSVEYQVKKTLDGANC